MKRGAVPIFLLIVVVPLLVSCRSAVDSEGAATPSDDQYEQRFDWTPRQGYQHLCSVKKFAFGGVGFAGITSDGEFAFRAVMLSPKAAELFRDGCVQATDEGKLYALCGLRQIDKEAYDHYVTTFRLRTNYVRTQSGCVMRDKPMSMVVGEIVDGNYDSNFAEK